MKVTIDEDRCRGYGVCWSICPEVFQLDPDGMGIVLFEEPPEELRAAVNDAARQCPERAITVE